MLRKLRPRRPSPAMLVALLALFVALGGSAYAAFVVSSNSQIGPDTIYGASKPASANDNVVAGSIAGTDIAPSSVGTNKVIDNSLGSIDLAPNSVDTSELKNGSVTSAKIADGAVAPVDLAPEAGGARAYGHVDRDGGVVRTRNATVQHPDSGLYCVSVSVPGVDATNTPIVVGPEHTPIYESVGSASIVNGADPMTGSVQSHIYVEWNSRNSVCAFTEYEVRTFYDEVLPNSNTIQAEQFDAPFTFVVP